MSSLGPSFYPEMPLRIPNGCSFYHVLSPFVLFLYYKILCIQNLVRANLLSICVSAPSLGSEIFWMCEALCCVFLGCISLSHPEDATILRWAFDIFMHAFREHMAMWCSFVSASRFSLFCCHSSLGAGESSVQPGIRVTAQEAQAVSCGPSHLQIHRLKHRQRM